MTQRFVIGLDEVTVRPPADFAVCALRSPADGFDPLFPVPAPGRDAIEPEAGDGSQVQSFPCTGVAVFDPKRRFRARAVAWRVQLTDARLTLASSDRPRLRVRSGRMLVGHVRYAWIEGVYAQTKQGPLKPEIVRVVLARADGTTAQLDVELPGDFDAIAVAETLIRRAGLAAERRLERVPGQVVGVSRR